VDGVFRCIRGSREEVAIDAVLTGLLNMAYTAWPGLAVITLERRRADGVVTCLVNVSLLPASQLIHDGLCSLMVSSIFVEVGTWDEGIKLPLRSTSLTKWPLYWALVDTRRLLTPEVSSLASTPGAESRLARGHSTAR
jgi:hypothetical protein